MKGEKGNVLFNTALKEGRDKIHLSRGVLSKKTGWPKKLIAEWENRISLPAPELLDKIAELYQVDRQRLGVLYEEAKTSPKYFRTPEEVRARSHPQKLKPRQTPDVDGATICERYHNYEQKCGGSLRYCEIIAFIGLENARALYTLGGTNNEKEVLALRDECCAFFQELYHRQDIERLFKALMENWPQMPLVLRVGMDEYNDRSGEAYDEIFDREVCLSKEEQHQVAALVDYIFKHDCDRTVSVTVAADDGEDFESNSISVVFPKDIAKDQIKDAREALTQVVAVALEMGGGIVVRLHGIGSKGKDVINGFHLLERVISKVPVQELKECSETMPDGTRSKDQTAEYQMAFVNLG